jgi:hypothetical protein
MFAMLTGRGLFPATTPIEWLTSHVRVAPPHLGDVLPELAPLEALDALLQRCLAKRASDRPASAAALVAELEAIDRAQVAPIPVAHAETAAHGPPIAASFSPSAFVSPLAFAPTGEVAPTPARRRGTWLVVGAAAVTVVAAIAVAVTQTGRRPEPPRPRPADAAVVAVAAPVAVDAGSVPPDAGAPDAGLATAHVAHANPEAVAHANPEVAHANPEAVAHANPEAVAHANPEVARYLAEAEAAKRAGNRMRWVSQADSALRLDPTNTRAKLLLAEGLIAYGDLEHGCKYLRELGRNPTALRMAQASCRDN